MNNDISIRVPKVMVTPAELATLEGFSRNYVYQMIHRGVLAKYMNPKTKQKERVLIHYVRLKSDQMSKALGHSNFKITVGA